MSVQCSFPRSSARNSQVRFEVRHLIDSYVMKFSSSKRTYEIHNELRKSPVKSFVKRTVRLTVCNCSASSVPTDTAAFHRDLDSVVTSQDCGLIPADFRSRFQVPLKRSLGRPRGLEPDESLPYSRSLGILPSSMRRTWPSQQRWRWLRSL